MTPSPQQDASTTGPERRSGPRPVRCEPTGGKGHAGRSYLCHDSYCWRYPARRSGTILTAAPATSASEWPRTPYDGRPSPAGLSSTGRPAQYRLMPLRTASEIREDMALNEYGGAVGAFYGVTGGRDESAGVAKPSRPCTVRQKYDDVLATPLRTAGCYGSRSPPNFDRSPRTACATTTAPRHWLPRRSCIVTGQSSQQRHGRSPSGRLPG